MDDTTTYVIYKHTSPSGKSYIGQTKDYDRRCWQHQTTDGCRALANARLKYGWDNFTHEILMENLSLDDANHWEPALILENNTLAPNGYNLMTGGCNSQHTEDTKVKISTDKLGKKRGPNKFPHSDDTKAKMSKSSIGKTHSEHTKAKMSAAKLGILKSDTHKAKMSEAKLGKKRGPYKKKVTVELDIPST
jgi:group I intron endonuclease